MNVGLLDYGVGNLGSLTKVIYEIGEVPLLIKDLSELREADCLILPGVGSFSECAEILHRHGWIQAIQKTVIEGNMPILGICLGMQLLASSSTEGVKEGGVVSGLGLVPGKVLHLKELKCNLRVPHVGWNNVTKKEFNNNILFKGVDTDTDFYFAHSYGFLPSNTDEVIATVSYGVNIAAAVNRGHIWGTQFHPEKSSKAGLQIIRNFIEFSKC